MLTKSDGSLFVVVQAASLEERNDWVGTQQPCDFVLCFAVPFLSLLFASMGNNPNHILFPTLKVFALKEAVEYLGSSSEEQEKEEERKQVSNLHLLLIALLQEIMMGSHAYLYSFSARAFRSASANEKKRRLPWE